VGDVYPGTPDLAIFLGNGDGTFPLPLELSFGTAGGYSSATSMAVSDLNNDSFPDVVMATNTCFATGVGFNAVTVVLNCGLACTNTAVTSSVATSVFNQPVTFTATVTRGNAKATATPTGSVIFQNTVQSDEGPPVVTTLGMATLSAGTATFVYSGLPIGSNSVSASYQGDSNFAPSTAPLSLPQTVTMAPTSTAAGSTPDPSSPGQSVTFTAQVTPSTSGVPTGNVTFSDNGTASVTVQLDSTGAASFTTSSLTTGTHSITWSYSGDSDFEPSTSPALTQIVGTNAAPFVLTPSATSATVAAGQSATFSIAVAAVPSLTTAITFSCSGLPAMAMCTFNPSSVNPHGSSAKTKLTISTTAPSALFKTPWQLPPKQAPLILILYCGLLAALWRAIFKRPVERCQPALLARCALVLLLAMAAGVAACGGGGGGGSSNPGTPSGVSQVVVTGTSGSTTQSVTLTLTVQ
jgi:Bacterial Ig-like domain (group 3)